MFGGFATCYFFPEWLRCLWAPDTKFRAQENSGQIIIDIISPRAFSSSCMDAPDRRLWRPCPSPATLTTDGDCLLLDKEEDRLQSDWSYANNLTSDRSSHGPDVFDSASACCSSNGSSWSISPRSFNSPRGGSESGNDDGEDALVYAADSWGPVGDLMASDEKEALTSSYNRLLVASDVSSASAPCRITPRTSQHYITQGYGLNDFNTGAAVCEATLAGSLGANALQHAVEVPIPDIDGLLASVIATALWQDDA
ncbi:hypothetical protein VaNZ11_012495 [Volvox africanus]|uniref:Uncharacterized protein n=1 Tax=Volvox africanus TaxID=51714 RepID=A0ABQ5SE01_9CHLO|nr:hypothetical protein VaNZ11_012495 [Volvox africanus]